MATSASSYFVRLGMRIIVAQKRKRVRLGVRNTAAVEGELDLRSWDIDELLMGRQRNKAGDFRGRPPTMVPKAIQDEAVRRVLTDVQAIITRAGVPAAELLHRNLTEGPDSDAAKASLELKTAQEVLNRLLGKPKERVDVTHEIRPWERLTAVVVNRRDEPQALALPSPADDEPWEDD